MRKFTYAETFVGAGGSHLGFVLNGYKAVYLNEANKTFIATLIKNNPQLRNVAIDVKPIEEVDPRLVLKRTGLKRGELDVLFGGVVCKGYSLAGVRDPNDHRNIFYQYQLKLAKYLLPRVSVIENVPSMMNALIPSSTLPKETRERISYICQQLENFKGIKAELRKKGARLSKVEEEEYERIKRERKHLEEILKEHSISVVEDIENIYKQLGYKVYKSKLNAAWYGSATKRVRLFIVAVRNDINKVYEFPEIEYYDDYLGPTYGIKMKRNVKKPRTVKDALSLIDYDGMNSPEVDEDNRPMRHSEKTVRRFKYIPPGKNIVDVMDAVPEELRISRYYSRGCTMRLDPGRPAPTLVPGHSNFPVHPTEDRSITVREAATISGFPLDYKFVGNHTQRCEQVGNAVPVELAAAIARSIKKLLR